MQQNQAAEQTQPARIHPTAIVEDGAQIGAGSVVGPYAYVGADVTLGSGCRLHHHATVEGLTSIGRNCEIFPYACVGLKTQDLKFQGGQPGLRAGEGNIFREFCTIHCATFDGDFTIIGNDNYFLAYTHVAHDCEIGNGVIMSNNATLAGHVLVGDYVVIGGMAGVHQFCRIGARAMIGGCSKVEKDIPPFLIADGQPALVRGMNLVGLQRAGFSEERISLIKTAYKLLYRDGFNRSQALAKLAAHSQATTPEFRAFSDFAAKSERGFAPGARRGVE